MPEVINSIGREHIGKYRFYIINLMKSENPLS